MTGPTSVFGDSRPRHFFKYVTAATAKLVLQNLTLRWSSPLIFDDIYDATVDWVSFFQVDHPLIDDVLPVVERLLRSNDPLPAGMPPILRIVLGGARWLLPITTMDTVLRSTKARLTAFVDTKRDELLGDNSRWSAVMRGARIFCVTEVPDSITMWALYADMSRGVMLRLDCTPESPWCSARRVSYSTGPPVVGTREAWIHHFLGIEKLDLSGIAEAIVFTKSHDWSEQREWRCWRRGAALPAGAPLSDLLPLDPREIGAIHLGARIQSTDREQLVNLVNGPLAHAEVWQARPRRGAYGVAYERVR